MIIAKETRDYGELMVYEVSQKEQICWVVAYESHSRDILKPLTLNLSTSGSEVHIRLLRKVIFEPNTRDAIIQQGKLEESV